MEIKIIPLIILAALSCIDIGLVWGKHGQEKPPHNGWITLIAQLAQWGLILWMIL